MHRFRPLLAVAFVSALLAPTVGAQRIPDQTPKGVLASSATIADDTGLTELIQRTGGNQPTGLNVDVAMAEAPSSTSIGVLGIVRTTGR